MIERKHLVRAGWNDPDPGPRGKGKGNARLYMWVETRVSPSLRAAIAFSVNLQWHPKRSMLSMEPTERGVLTDGRYPLLDLTMHHGDTLQGQRLNAGGCRIVDCEFVGGGPCWSFWLGEALAETAFRLLVGSGSDACYDYLEELLSDQLDRGREDE